jgi:hypothetical protein
MSQTAVYDISSSYCGALSTGWSSSSVSEYSFDRLVWTVRPITKNQQRIFRQLAELMWQERLSNKTSRLHPRHVAPQPAQAYEPKVPV